MSRLDAIRTAIETHVTTAISGVTTSNDPNAFANLPQNQLPHAIIIFEEDDPEALDFKQERRRVVGRISIGYEKVAGATEEASREVVRVDLEAIRDAIFADPDLTDTVDNARIEAAAVFSGREDPIVVGQMEVSAEEIF